MKSFVEHGVQRAFCVPGESYLAILEAIREQGDAFDLVVCRHEGGAAYMAEASGRITGKPGICLVTRGPGACNAAIGVHTAQHEGTPMILLVGDVTRGTKGQFAFQDIDLHQLYGGMAKQVLEIQKADDAYDVMDQAFRIATTGRPGPVVIGVPDDVQFDEVPCRETAHRQELPWKTDLSHDVAEVADRLAAAQRPLLVVGGTGWTQQASSRLANFAERLGIPVASTFRRHDLLDNRSESYVGSIGIFTPPTLHDYLTTSDLIISISGTFGEIETARYKRMVTPSPSRYLVHVAREMAEFDGAVAPDLAIIGDAENFCNALNQQEPACNPLWNRHRQTLRAGYMAYSEPVDFGDRINPASAVSALAQRLPERTIVTLGAGNYTHFVLRHHPFHELNTLLAPVCAPMGYSIPAAISAAMQCPAQEVVAYAGDGCFLMNAQELVIAVKRRLKLTVIVMNNGIYGSIRMHQEFRYPGRPIATNLDNPDFVQFANSMGIPARRIDDPRELSETWQTMRRSTDGPIFIEMSTDPAIINTERLIQPGQPQ
ncbi:thiamine pyrophosphate-binding protein [Paraburkholderia sp. G-4-1-8]|uniref:Thiamine pyrophosphate-binding protein n=1 Tax=Paraburkholderia antibiotica TaxID=2728839 RepID=A0A7Y0FFF4_9BURK|nr:thiamine pyrophosphate-binding protein [Paraburkholderia antibiotica]